MYHKTETGSDSKIQHKYLFKLSPVEILEEKEYVSKLIKTGNFCGENLLMDLSFFLVKDKDTVQGVVDYGGLNRRTNRNNCPLKRSD